MEWLGVKWDPAAWGLGTDFGIGLGIGVGVAGLGIGPGAGIGLSREGGRYRVGVGAGVRGGLAVGPACKTSLRIRGVPVVIGFVMGPAAGYGTATQWVFGKGV